MKSQEIINTARLFYRNTKGFFNRFVNNTVKGGRIEIKDQISFTNENNNIL